MPPTLGTDIGSVLRLVACTTGGAFLAGIRRVYCLNFDAKPFCLVGEKQRELIEAPAIRHAVVFAGRCPTTCTCGALAYACKRLDFDRSHPLLRGVIDHLTRKLVVDIPHPAAFFVLPFLDGTGLVRLLELLALAIEARRIERR